MTFVQLYGDAVSRELGSADTTLLFTTARRKAAINEGQLWFSTETECLQRTAAIAIVDGTGEYDLEAIAAADYLWLAKQGPEVKADPGGGGQILYYSGADLPRRTVEWLNRYESGWRTASAGVPSSWYERDEGGQVFMGLHPAPDVPAGATWTLNVPYVVKPADMVADVDEPFTVSTNPLKQTAPWHDALSYYAASELEKLRKGLERSALFRRQAEARVLDYLDKQRAPGGRTVSVARSYRREASRGRGGWPYYNRFDDPWK